MKPILTLDFDGVIHSYTSGWKGASVITDDPVPGALDFIVDALEQFRVAIHSSRSHQWLGRRAMKQWLRKRICMHANNEATQSGALYERVWGAASNTLSPWYIVAQDEADAIVREIEWPLFKPPSMVSIDDRCVTFTGRWPSLAELRSFKPWNKS